MQAFKLLAYQTGIRRGEIMSLRWEQVDVKHGIIRLRSSNTKTGKAWVIPLMPVLPRGLTTLPRGSARLQCF
jgi:integrase